MDTQSHQAREHIVQAREALRRGDKASARLLGEQAAQLAPDMEDAWLILAAPDPDPHDALAYARKALQLNPQSGRAHRGVEWAERQLKQIEEIKARIPVSAPPRPNQVGAVARLPEKQAYQTVVAAPQPRSNGRNWLLPALLTGGICMLLGFVALFALASPALASLVRGVSAPALAQENLWAPVDMARPEVSAIESSAFAAQAADTPTAVPTVVPTEPPTLIPSEAPTEQAIPSATDTPGSFVLEIVEDTATSEYIPPSESVPPKEEYASSGNGERWIDVDLTNQQVYAYEGDVVVNSFIVSTGTWLTPTVTGKYKIYVKVRIQDMSGPGYHLKDVPYVMFFHGDYGLHGTYWHNNFGTPMSRGCINLTIDDAAWLFNWASVGTVVNVHY